jgi:hypothetical protein
MEIISDKLNWIKPPKLVFNSGKAILKKSTTNSQLIIDRVIDNSEKIYQNSNEKNQLILDKRKKIYLYNEFWSDGSPTLLSFIHDVFFPLLALSHIYRDAVFLIDERYNEMLEIPDLLLFFTNLLDRYKIKYCIIKKEYDSVCIDNWAIFERRKDPIKHNLNLAQKILKTHFYTKSNNKIVFYGIKKNSENKEDLQIKKYCYNNNIDILYPEDFLNYSQLIEYIQKIKIMVTTAQDNITQSMYFAQRGSTIMFLASEHVIKVYGWNSLCESGKTLIAYYKKPDIVKFLESGYFGEKNEI